MNLNLLTSVALSHPTRGSRNSPENVIHRVGSGGRCYSEPRTAATESAVAKRLR